MTKQELETKAINSQATVKEGMDMVNMKRKKFAPKAGDIYRNQGGGIFRCLQSGYTAGEATMQNVKSGWTLYAHGCGIYEDGTMDWDYSTGGYFAEVLA